MTKTEKIAYNSFRTFAQTHFNKLINVETEILSSDVGSTGVLDLNIFSSIYSKFQILQNRWLESFTGKRHHLRWIKKVILQNLHLISKVC
jgi:hypothetical protein